MSRKIFCLITALNVRTLTMCAISLATLLCLSAVAHGQEKGFQPGGTYAFSDVEAINAENGNMIVQIPLASLHQGRGGVPGPQLKLVYNSKLYATHYEEIPDPGHPGQISTQIFLNPDDDAGWKY